MTKSAARSGTAASVLSTRSMRSSMLPSSVAPARALAASRRRPSARANWRSASQSLSVRVVAALAREALTGILKRAGLAPSPPRPEPEHTPSSSRWPAASDGIDWYRYYCDECGGYAGPPHRWNWTSRNRSPPGPNRGAVSDAEGVGRLALDHDALDLASGCKRRPSQCPSRSSASSPGC